MSAEPALSSGSLLWPLAQDHICGTLSEHADVHAVTTSDAFRQQRETGRRTVRAVCGVDVFVFAVSYRTRGGDSGGMAIAWPPPAVERCPTCAARTCGTRLRHGGPMWRQYVASPTDDDTGVSQG